MSISNAGETLLLDALPGTVYIKMHLGDPGEDGTANPAADTRRMAITLAAASGNTRSMSGTGSLTSVTNTETYTHWSMWSTVGPAGGTCYWTGALGASEAVTAGDNFTLDTLSLTLD